MIIKIVLVLLALCTVSAHADILVYSPNGKYVKKTSLAAAAAAADSAGKTVVVTSALSSAQSNIIADWPSDRTLEFKPGGSINNTTTFKLNNPFIATSNGVFKGIGDIIFGSGSTPGINPAWRGSTDTANVQWAIDTSKNSGWMPVVIDRAYTLTSSVMIDRPVNYQNQEFHIIGQGLNAGFYTSAAISMFSSNITTTAGPEVEFITFEGIRFESTANTINNFAVDGSKFLRMRFDNCFFRRIRCAYTPYYFQSWRFSNCNSRGVFTGTWDFGWKGKFLESAMAAYDLQITDNIFEFGDDTDSQFLYTGTTIEGSSFKGNLFENNTGPFITTAGFKGGSIEGNYFEALTLSALKLGLTQTLAITGNQFNTSNSPTYYAVDCQTSITLSSSGNWAYGNLFDNHLMSQNGAFLRSTGDFSFGGNVYYGLQSDTTGFTAAVTGCTTNPAPTVTITRLGPMISARISDFICTSNSDSMTISNWPTALFPQSTQDLPIRIVDVGAYNWGVAIVTNTTIGFSKDAAGNTFTASGNKGIVGGSFTYKMY